MWKRIYALTWRDVQHSLRDFILLYALVMPFILGLIFRAVVPAVGGTSINLAVTAEMDEDTVEQLREYASVEVLPGEDALRDRVNRLDDMAGIVEAGGEYKIILQGNEGEETRELVPIVLSDILTPDPLPIEEEELGRAASPTRAVLATLLGTLSLLLGGMLMGFHIIEDKESGTIQALGVSPLSWGEYIVGRTLLGVVSSVFSAVGALWVMGMPTGSFSQILAVTLGSSVAAVLFGLYTGSIADNQIAGVATTKVGGWLFLIGPVLMSVLPDKWEFTVYWLPTYWTARAYWNIFTLGAAWRELGLFIGLSAGISLLAILVFWQPLRRKLSLRG